MMGLLVGLGVLLLGLRCDARDSNFYPEGFKKDGFQLLGDDAECSVLAAFQLVQSDWGSILDYTEMGARWILGS